MPISCSEAYKLLKMGNAAFVSGSSKHPHEDFSTRRKVLQGQHPFAVVLCCSDSRVIPELIFDTGIGDLFVIRVAGNVVDNVVVASIEYAVAHLESSLVMVLGHESCGAVAATVNHEESGHLTSLTKRIAPAVAKAKSKGRENLLENSVKCNAVLTAEELWTNEPILKSRCESGKLKILPAYYALKTGEVSFLNNES